MPNRWLPQGFLGPKLLSKAFHDSWGENVHLSGSRMLEEISWQLQAEEASACSHRRETLQVRYLRKEVFFRFQLEDSFEDAHRGEAIRLLFPKLLQEIHLELQFDSSWEDTPVKGSKRLELSRWRQRARVKWEEWWDRRLRFWARCSWNHWRRRWWFRAPSSDWVASEHFQYFQAWPKQYASSSTVSNLQHHSKQVATSR